MALSVSTSATVARSLSEERDFWRERCRQVETSLVGDAWDVRIKPYTLWETRVLRLLARHEVCRFDLLLHALYTAHNREGVDIRTLRTVVSRIRTKLPRNLSVTSIREVGWEVNNRGALQHYLDKLSTKNRI